MSVPVLLPRYTFSLTEACTMWAHVEAEIELAVEQAGDRVHLAIAVTHACNPFGDHQEWAWTARREVDGTIVAGAAAGTVRITTTDPVVPVLTFDAATAEHDTMWSDDSASLAYRPPPFDFWAPLFAWGWAQQVPGWIRTLTDDDLARVVAGEPALPRVDQKDSEWGARILADRLRHTNDGRFSTRRGLGYALEPGARCEKRPAEASAANRRGWVIVFLAYTPVRVEELLTPGPPVTATAEQVGLWYRSRAGRRPEYALGWLPDEHDADTWLAFLNADLAARVAVTVAARTRPA